MNTTKDTKNAESEGKDRKAGFGEADCSPLERLAKELDMPIEHVRGACNQIAKEHRLERKIEAMKSGNAGILPTGEIVDRRERPEAMPYKSSLANTELTKTANHDT